MTNPDIPVRTASFVRYTDLFQGLEEASELFTDYDLPFSFGDAHHTLVTKTSVVEVLTAIDRERPTTEIHADAWGDGDEAEDEAPITVDNAPPGYDEVREVLQRIRDLPSAVLIDVEN